MNINATNRQRIESYAARSGKTASAVANEALDYWYENYGKVVLSEMIKRDRRRRSRVLTFPTAS